MQSLSQKKIIKILCNIHDKITGKSIISKDMIQKIDIKDRSVYYVF